MSNYHKAHQTNHRNANNSDESLMKCMCLGAEIFKNITLVGASGSVSFLFLKFARLRTVFFVCVCKTIKVYVTTCHCISSPYGRFLGACFGLCTVNPWSVVPPHPAGDADGAVSARQVTAAPGASGTRVSLRSLHTLAGGCFFLLSKKH